MSCLTVVEGYGVEGLAPIMQLFDSNTYFILAHLTNKTTSQEFCAEIGRHKVLIRDCFNFEGLSGEYVRFSLKTRQDNLNLANLIKQAL